MSSIRWRGVVALCAGLAAAVCGCNNARMVQWNGTTGVVAIPHNDDAWPDKNREHAEALMKATCPHGYTILHEHEVVVGGEVDHSVARVGYLRIHETSYHPVSQWQIVFQSADAPLLPPPPVAPTVIPTQAVMPAPPPSASPGLPPAPIPVDQ